MKFVVRMALTYTHPEVLKHQCDVETARPTRMMVELLYLESMQVAALTSHHVDIHTSFK